MRTPENLVDKEISVVRSTQKYKLVERALFTSATIGLALSCLGSGGDTKPVYANGPGEPVSTPIPTNTPIPTATPNALATSIANTKETLRELTELQQALDALRNPTPAAPPQQQQQQQSSPGVLIVPQQVVKPEVVVCEPKIVEIEKPVRIQVEVTPLPDPNKRTLSIEELRATREQAREEGAEQARKKAEEELKACQAAQEAAKQAETEAKTELEIAKARDWTYNWWYALVGGAVGLGLGLAAATREFVVERIHPHHH